VALTLRKAVADHAAGRLAQAAAGFETVLRSDPGQFDALHRLAMIEAERGHPDQAIALFERAIAAGPRRAVALRNFGAYLQTQGRVAEAIQLYRRAIALEPGGARSHAALAFALRAQRDDTAAEAACREAIRLDPRLAIAHLTLAGLHRDRGRLEAAVACYRQALEADPEQPQARAALFHLLRQICDWREVAALGERIDRESAAAVAAERCPGEPALVALSRRMDPAFALDVARRWSAEIARRVQPLPPAPAPRTGLIRLGYISGDFHDHATAHLLRGLFPAHDRREFEVVAYSYGPDDGSEYRRSLIAGCDRFVELSGMDHRTAAERIRADGIEILIDLKGHMQGARLEITAARPAPVQVAWLGFPGSLGAGFIDYAIVDAVVAPHDHARFFSEKLVVMPDCYQPTDDTQPIAAEQPSRAEVGLAIGVPVFANFNQAYKIEPELFAAWMRILTAVPGSQLWLLSENEACERNLRAAATGCAIDPDRLRFAPRVPKDRHLARLRLADLALDTRTLNGHTTTTDCLWAGLPVLAILGGHFASRVSASLLGAIGLPELVVPDLAAYERAAVEFGRDPARLAAVRAKLAANREFMPLFDTGRFVRALEMGYRRMSTLLRAGKPAEAIDLRTPAIPEPDRAGPPR